VIDDELQRFEVAQAPRMDAAIAELRALHLRAAAP
jgi:uncharacterized protein (DUF1810 family)